ncbi:hypothetical protein AB9F39_38805, partial [Rhizobium leguminosarum]|uniref:hypothetical protein n=1 Tax=Rhizobium leguminosarum TaxID=384 RepID=UPI003F970F10
GDAGRIELHVAALRRHDRQGEPHRVGTKLWNATRFAEMNGAKSDPHFVPEAAELTINRWILTELARTERDVTEALEAF